MHKTFGPLALAFGAAMLLTPPAQASNIVQDPGFELEDISGGPVTSSNDWTFSAVDAILDAGIEGGFSNSGNNAAYIGYGMLSQNLATVIGTTYSVSFYVGIDDNTTLTDPNALFTASLGGQDLLNGSLTPGPPFPGSFIQCPSTSSPCVAETTDTFTATSTASLLTFTGLTSVDGSPLGLWYIDDIDVEALSVAAPEPSAELLFCSALGLIALARRRRA
jgi:hypothetical protein